MKLVWLKSFYGWRTKAPVIEGTHSSEIPDQLLDHFLPFYWQKRTFSDSGDIGLNTLGCKYDFPCSLLRFIDA